MIDSYRHKGLRKQLVTSVRNKGIADEKILEAIGSVPRHFFMDSSFLEFAYQDKPFPIGSGQTISQPYTVAFQTRLLEVKKGDKILEVGTGSGYQACILSHLGAIVYSIERQKKLYEKTSNLIPKLGYYVKCYFGDGYKGLPVFAPFDKILITAGAPVVPEILINQLRTGGILVSPVGSGDTQIMKKIVRLTDDEFSESDHGHFRFVPMLNNTAND